MTYSAQQQNPNYSTNCNHQNIYNEGILLDVQYVNPESTTIISNNTFGLMNMVWQHDNFCSNYYDYFERYRIYALRLNYTQNFSVYNNVFKNIGNSSDNSSSKTIYPYPYGSTGTPFISHNYIEQGLQGIQIPVNNEYNNNSALLILMNMERFR